MKTPRQIRNENAFDGHFREIGKLTALSRLLGFLRDISLAHFLGAGPAADAFLVAFKLPNLFRRLTAEGAMTNAFLPVFARVRQETGRPAALILAAEIQIILLLVLSAIVVVAEIFMPAIIALLAPGFVQTPERFEATVILARIAMPYLPMISLVALWAAVTNAHDRFFGGAAAPVILNICLIGGTLCIPLFQMLNGTYSDGVSHLALLAMPVAIAVLVAGVCQMALMQRMLGRIDASIKWQKPRMSQSGKRVWRAFVPAALGAGGLQLNLLIDMILASLVSVGAISWLYYADRIVQLPLGIIGIALGTALLPQLSKLESEDNKADVAERIAHSLHIAAFFALPACVAVIVTCDPIIGGLFGYGAFGSGDVAMTASALAAYGVGLPAFVFNKVLQPAFFASNRGAIVLKVSFLSVGVNLVGSLTLMPILGHVGLALATSAASWVAVAIMTVMLLSEGRLKQDAFAPFLPVGFASLVMGAILFAGHLMVTSDLMPFLTTMMMGTAIIMTILVIAGLGSYFLAAYLCGAIPAFLFKRLQPAGRKKRF